MPSDGIFTCQQYRVIPPCDAVCSDNFRKFCQRGHALINAGNTRFNFLSVGRNRIVEVGMEALGDAVDMRKNGGIIFRAEHNTVHLVRRQFITGHLMLEQGIAGKDIAFFKPLQQPAGVILDGVCPSSCIDNHSVFLLMD